MSAESIKIAFIKLNAADKVKVRAYIKSLSDSYKKPPLKVKKYKVNTITGALKHTLSSMGCDIENKYTFSDNRTLGISVKICNLKLTKAQEQEVKSKMENLGYTYHSIKRPSHNHGSPYYRDTFKGTRFHFS